MRCTRRQWSWQGARHHSEFHRLIIKLGRGYRKEIREREGEGEGDGRENDMCQALS